MVVRELIARFGFEPDMKGLKKIDKGFKEVEKKANSFTDRMKTLAATVGGLFAVQKAVQGLKFIISSASSVEEMLNVLDVTFGKSQKSVIKWAQTFSKAANRSEFDMREMAGTLGGVLNPLMEGNMEVAAAMSTRLSELVVDLGSLREAAEPEVLLALRSAITGEAEPMKRFGVVMTEATLKAFALSQGITKNIKKMTIAEKTALRYNFILDQTKTAHGDATKTAGGYANALKGLVARLKDVGTRLGLQLLPTVNEGVKLFTLWADGLGDFVGVLGRVIRTVSKVVLWVLKLVSNFSTLTKFGLVALAFMKWGKALKFLLTPFGKIMLFIGLLILIFDDLITWVEGGESQFGKLFKILDDLTGLPVSDFFRNLILAVQDFAGMEEPFDWGKYYDEMVQITEGHFAAAAQTWSNFFQGIRSELEQTVPLLVHLFDGLSLIIGETIDTALVPFFNFIADSFSATWDFIFAVFNKLKTWVVEAFDFWKNNWGGIADWISTNVIEPITGFFSEAWKVIKSGFNSFVDFVKKWGSKVAAVIAAPITGLGKLVGFLRGKKEVGIATKGFEKIAAGGAAQGGALDGMVGGRTINANRTTQSTMVDARSNVNAQFNIKGTPNMNEQKLAQKTGQEVQKVIDRQNRAAMRNLVPASVGN